MVFLENQDVVPSGQMDNACILAASRVIIPSLYEHLFRALDVFKFLHSFSTLRYDETLTPVWLDLDPLS